MFKREKVETKYLDSLVVWMFLAVLVGARLGHCLFYEPDYFCTSEHWLEIFLPFNIKTGQFTGYQGLASHGAAIAVILMIWFFSRKNNINAWWIFDRLVIVVALGGAFIRLGNLFNSEIYGVQTSLPWGFIFVRDGQTVPCHPTQIYEMLYCFVALCVVWPMYWYTEARRREGLLLGVFFEIIFVTRFLLEFIKNDQEAFEAGHVLNMGQWLSLPFIALGIFLIIRAYKRPLSPVVDKQPESLEPKYRDQTKVESKKSKVK
jgi:prolipoprotein diacylglyceryl transferase